MQKSLKGPILALVVLGLAAAGLFHELRQPLPAEPERAEVRVPCSFRSPGATYECWDEKTHKMRY